MQIEGLVGSNGILPLTEKLALIEQIYQDQRFWQTPTLFWVDSSDYMLNSVCYLGMFAACLLLFNVFHRVALFSCFFLYLSCVQAGQSFMHFQWDVLLLEVGFLALFLSWGSGIVIWLYRWLLVRFMFISGVVKIASGDANWLNFSALSFHYETQPLPTPFAYYIYQLPSWVHKICVGGMFFIELIVPFFVFLPRPFRLFACSAFMLLQVSIILTGNYTFFNLLVILLCLLLLEDTNLIKIVPKNWILAAQKTKTEPGYIAHFLAGLWAGLVMLICASQLWYFHMPVSLPTMLQSLLRASSTFSLVNNYGPFAVMTTKRYEIIVQGSDDEQHWQDYQFKYKPGRLMHLPVWNIPHQPRLDWQMWFAALSPSRPSYWFGQFQKKLLDGSPQVLSLLDYNPFPKQPPKYIRSLLYQYRYTFLEQRADDKQIWQRQYLDVYWPSSSTE